MGNKKDSPPTSPRNLRAFADSPSASRNPGEEKSSAGFAHAMGGQLNFFRVEKLLKQETRIPEETIDQVIRQIQISLPRIGWEKPTPAFIIQWLSGLLTQMGYSVEDLPYQSLELSLENVEMNMLNPAGNRVGHEVSQSPQATSLKIAQHVKKQVALRRVYQPQVIQAHNDGLIDIDHLGDVDRPHDMFLTPELIKCFGLPTYSHTPQAGPPKHPEVLLSHLVRFTHELQNHFAGTIYWGFTNTLIAPFFKGKSDAYFRQFAQQLLFEFAQLDVGNGGLPRRVVLDFDLEIPAYLEKVEAVGPGGEKLSRPYGFFAKELEQVNHAILDVMAKGDSRGCPFFAPQIVFHVNHLDEKWNQLHQKLFSQAFRSGLPVISLSHNRRSLGPIGVVDVHDPDWIQRLQKPSELRGFSLSSLSLNLPRLFLEDKELPFEEKLDRALHIALSAHREKRIFISNLMSKGHRGPHQFLRHKINGVPLLKIGQGSLGTAIVGLGEAAALSIGNASPNAPDLARSAGKILIGLREKLNELSRIHKLNMYLCDPVDEEVTSRFAVQDFKQFGSFATSFIFKQESQTEPVYSSGSQILFDKRMKWEARMELEGKLQQYLNGERSQILFYGDRYQDDPLFFQKLYEKMRENDIIRLQLAPDMKTCLACGQILSETDGEGCPHCHSVQISDFGLCQSVFSPVAFWSRGKQEEWRLRHRIDQWEMPTQEILPFF